MPAALPIAVSEAKACSMPVVTDSQVAEAGEPLLLATLASAAPTACDPPPRSLAPSYIRSPKDALADDIDMAAIPCRSGCVCGVVW
eukprot:1142352-Prymnesium_polylepis.1